MHHAASYLKNAALLTGSDVVLRLAGMGLRIWLANELGGEGMGLYQLVLAVYSLFITLATAGVSVAATRLMAEELSGPDSARGAARGMLRRLLAAGLLLGLFAAALQLTTADLAARWWLGDVRAARSVARFSAGNAVDGSVCGSCGAFSSPAGMWPPMCSASLPNRRCALRW